MPVTIENATTEEADVARALVTGALVRGWTVSVNDGEEWTVVRSNDADKILAALASTDSDTLSLRGSSGERIGTLLLVWGNAGDGSELIADYSDTPSMTEFVDDIGELCGFQ